MTENEAASRYRWFVVVAFQLSTAINYLDRQTLAVLGPGLSTEFHIDKAQFGWLIGIFSAAYAIASPFAGALIDRIGLNAGASVAVGLWSAAGIATGFTNGLGGLIGCRTVLGIAESGGIPAAGKALHKYLKVSERALGNATNQIGVSLGMMTAPPFAVWAAAAYGWRAAFLITGLTGVMWIPFWNFVARAFPAPDAPKKAADFSTVWADTRLWYLALANALTMVGYSLWTTWIMFYLEDELRLTPQAAAGYAWIPPLPAMAAGLAGGALSAKFIGAGSAATVARFRVCQIGAVVALAGLAVPLAHTPGLATALICVTFGAIAAMSTNVYSLPLDIFGGARAASAVAGLVASYGAMQFVLSPLFGWIIQNHGYAPVIVASAVTPAAACVVLWRSGAVS